MTSKNGFKTKNRMINLSKIDIELNTSCNLKCKQCPYKKTHKNPQFMSFELYKKIIDQIDWNCSIKLCQRGEPLLSPILEDVIEYASKKGLRTIINTNGVLLDKFKCKCLIQAGLAELILSDYNMKIQFKNGCVLRGMIRALKSSLIFTIKTFDRKKWEHVTNNIFEPIYYDYSNKEEDFTELPNWKCEQLFERLIVSPTGDVRCCCGNVHTQKYVGNINKQTIKEIWNSEKLNSYRKLHLDGNSHKLKMCQECAYRKSIVKERRNA